MFSRQRPDLYAIRLLLLSCQKKMLSCLDLMDLHLRRNVRKPQRPVGRTGQCRQVFPGPLSSIQVNLCLRIKEKRKTEKPADMVNVKMAEQNIRPFPALPAHPKSQPRQSAACIKDDQPASKIRRNTGGMPSIFQIIRFRHGNRTPHAPHLCLPYWFQTVSFPFPAVDLPGCRTGIYSRISSRISTSNPSCFPFKGTLPPREVTRIRSPSASATALEI